MLGRYVSDLQVGDIFPAMEYELTPFLIREYCHGVEETDERFLGAGIGGRQLAPPTMVHTDKIRMLEHACPGGPKEEGIGHEWRKEQRKFGEYGPYHLNSGKWVGSFSFSPRGFHRKGSRRSPNYHRPPMRATE